MPNAEIRMTKQWRNPNVESQNDESNTVNHLLPEASNKAFVIRDSGFVRLSDFVIRHPINKGPDSFESGPLGSGHSFIVSSRRVAVATCRSGWLNAIEILVYPLA